jgi:hypothetical protein
MPNTELLVKEAEELSPEYFTVVLDLIRSLKQAASDSHIAAPVPGRGYRRMLGPGEADGLYLFQRSAS